MITVSGQSHYSYRIHKTTGIFSSDNDLLSMSSSCKAGDRRFILIDSIVYSIYGKNIKSYFVNKGIEPKLCVMEAGDKNKSETTYLSIFKELCSFDTKRRSEPLIAIGGGVVTDLGGFVASTYRRGIPHIKVPTTLMGYVDASVGIKTGVNFGRFKNRMGTFEIPSNVVLDRSFLTTLDERNIINGMGEIIKLAIILDKTLFELLDNEGESVTQNRFQNKTGMEILDKSISGMVNELSGNLYEHDLKRKVDFGHTFSLIIESASNYNIMHGEAVAIDVLYSCCLAYYRGMLKEIELNRIINLYEKLKLPKWSPYLTPENIWLSVQERTIHRDGQQLIPVPCDIGSCEFINDLKYDEISSVLKLMSELKLMD